MLTSFLQQIEQIKSGGKLPILVGGTNYYIESILWNILIDSGDNQDAKDDRFLFSKEAQAAEDEETSHPTNQHELTAENIMNNKIHAKSFREIPSDHLYLILNQLDPQSAQLFHPQDKRKIIRALPVCCKTCKARIILRLS